MYDSLCTCYIFFAKLCFNFLILNFSLLQWGWPVSQLVFVHSNPSKLTYSLTFSTQEENRRVCLWSFIFQSFCLTYSFTSTTKVFRSNFFTSFDRELWPHKGKPNSLAIPTDVFLHRSCIDCNVEFTVGLKKTILVIY